MDVRFEHILDPEADDILLVESLKVGPLASVNWSTPASGIQVREGSEELERLWGEHLRSCRPDRGKAVATGSSALEGQLRVAVSRHPARERWLRDEPFDPSPSGDGAR
ncbi:hypothetical protein [Tautonia plasticadhaerens]|uniref:Uncharacterized protein n=1 Tax=Tautonia plasticadhaerens TaxID=2527974 RepID=A0A518H6F2_9BACT|nr:hypothetical protein [Tautonia plasticadhaerens]QDV36419.1 hypothetical protein ElP_43430 [Tautonia plasticadhaerens]